MEIASDAARNERSRSNTSVTSLIRSTNTNERILRNASWSACSTLRKNTEALVTDVFERERSFAAISRAIATDAGVADVSGYTDYGRVWLEFLAEVVDDLDPRSTVIVLGDARTNGREPHPQAFAQVSERAGRTFWMNPEPRLYWNYGDSVIKAYEEHCRAFECWTTAQLEDFVKALTQPITGR